MKRTQNMTERAAQAEAMAERLARCLARVYVSHACVGCTDEVRTVLAAWAEGRADMYTLAFDPVHEAEKDLLS